MADRKTPLDLEEARHRLGAAQGQDYWRSLEELAQADGFEELLEQEFPRQAGGWLDGLDRRQFLRLMGASLALAGLTGCGGPPREPIMPYVRPPEHIIPGRPLFFATAMPLAGYGSGLLVWSHEGRPTKVEGNPLHPTASKPADSPPHAHFGPSDLFAQASILGLYDPDRAQAVSHLGNASSWDSFATELNRRLRTSQGTINRNLRLRILTETVTSPTLAHLIQSILRDFPNARWHVYEPAGNDNERLGLRHALGRDAAVHYRLDRANVILALDADFLCSGPGHLRYARDFAERRRKRSGASLAAGVGAVGTPLTPLPPALALAAAQARPINRLYALECTPSGTGSMADHRRALRAAQIESFARAVAIRLGVPGVDPQGTGPHHGLPVGWIDALVSDLQAPANRGSAVVIAGQGQPPLVHALAAAINLRLGSSGPNGPVVYTDPIEFRPIGRSRPSDEDTDSLASLKELVAALRSSRAEDRVDMLLILGGNPVFTAPADLGLAEAMASVDFRVHLNLYEDETSELCHWHLPEAHYLEAWGDVRAFDGTASIIQPLIAPLYGGRSALEVLSLLPRQREGTEETLPVERSGYEIVRAYWRNSGGTVRPLQEQAEAPRTFSGNFESWWRKALHDGVIEGTAAARRAFDQPATGWQEAPGRRAGGELSNGRFEIVFRPDPTIFDGRFANNGWLQELPKPLSKVTWDNAAYISPVTAVEMGFSPQNNPERATEQVVIIEHGGRRVELPLFVLPGQAEDSITVHLGGGRTRAGRVGTGVGVNVYRLRGSASPWFVTGARVRSAGRLHMLARTQLHHRMHGRDIVRSGTMQSPPDIPAAANRPRDRRLNLSLYPDHPYEGNQWGMSIDLSLCNGCSACIVACQAENNIPVVGKDQVARGRELHWLRVDSYYKGDPNEPHNLQTFFQPVPCMHCENAPCEVVCPVEATAHSSDGLNDMVYNRCVGTRYCSNNCPYKVRRFNFLQYADWETEALRLGRNPNVTVRSRGVMEKCTYCVQRIRAGEIDAKVQGRDLRDGEIQTACQSACPAGAIVFGDVFNRSAHVTRLQSEPLNYGLLYELNTRPRTTYLAALKNPNPAILAAEGRTAP